jgi:hypothetical protein
MVTTKSTGSHISQKKILSGACYFTSKSDVCLFLYGSKAGKSLWFWHVVQNPFK